MDFFAGANTKNGFCSIFAEVLASAERVWIIKGTSGCGKSTFMKRIASEAESRGYSAHRVYCSGDPDSLDGVIVPELGFAAADGTAPHVLEPNNPVLREKLVDLGAFIDEKRLLPHKNEIADLCAEKAFCYSAAYRLLHAAGALASSADMLASYDEAGIMREARRALDKYAPSFGGGGTEKVFASAFTASGIKVMPCFGRAETLVSPGGDERAAKLFLRFAAEYAAESKRQCVLSLCATDGEGYDSVYFPPDGALFTLLKDPPCAEYSRQKTLNPGRFCRTPDKETKKRVKELDSLAANVRARAQSQLAEARGIHREIEKYYSAALDIAALQEYTEKAVKRVFGE
ncbi:MAG: hypothetical protein J5925_03825 [Clostridia bacterium]|nr:hypothetical protein [Clostridia bacterium]